MCDLLAGILLAWPFCIGAAAMDNDAPEAYAKRFSAKYEIIVDDWDYTEYEAGLDERVRALPAITVDAASPYTVGPRETTIYQLANGKYWFNQLYQHEIVSPGGNNPYPTFLGFNAEYLISALLAGDYEDMYDSGLWRTAEFTVNGMFVPAAIVPYGDVYGLGSGAYASAFELSALPGEIRFTMTATDNIPSTYHGIPGTLPKILTNHSFEFRGVIKITEVQEIVPSPRKAYSAPGPSIINGIIISCFSSPSASSGCGSSAVK